jgi:hypothetical protein
VREYEQRVKSRDGAVEKCMAKDILQELLESCGAELINMLMTEQSREA